MSNLQWESKPLSEIKDGEFVPVGELSSLIRTHASQVHEWIGDKKIPFKKGTNNNRPTKMVKVLPLAKMVTVLKNCGMSAGKLEVLEAEGYATEPLVKATKKAKKKKGYNKPGPKPQGYKKPGPKPNAKPKKPGPKPKRQPVLSGSSTINSYIDQAEKHGLDIKPYATLIEDAIEAGIVAAL